MTQHQIKYTGPTQHTRQISVKDAKAASFVLAKDLEWSLANRHTLLLEDLDETALDYFKSDDDFKVTEVASEDEAPAAKKEVEGEVADDAKDGAAGTGSGAGRGRTTTSTTTATP